MTLTKRQAEVRNWIASFIDEKGYSPNYAEMCAGLGLRSLATISKHIRELERKGFVGRDFSRIRSIEILSRGSTARPRRVTCPNCKRIFDPRSRA